MVRGESESRGVRPCLKNFSKVRSPVRASARVPSQKNGAASSVIWRRSGTHTGLRAIACELIVIATRLDLSGSDPLDAAVVEAAARGWATHQIRRQQARMLRFRVA